jgi:hypothetical protein
MLLWFTALIKHASWLILHNRKNIKKGRRANKSNLKKSDAIFIFSVGGGNKKKKVSENLISAIKYAKFKKAKIFSIVGRKDGYAY